MKSDTLDLFMFYVVVLAVVGGGLGFLYVTRSEPTADNLQILIGGFIGAALQAVFGRQTQKQTARQQERALLTNPAGNGVQTAYPEAGTVTVTATSEPAEGAP